MGDDFAGAHDALDRMKRAYGRGTGCHLTAEMIASLSVTVIGQMWDDDRSPPPCGLAPASSEGDRE